MNVASLELCRELYELSGWHDTYLEWFIDKDEDQFTRPPEVGRRSGSRQSKIFDFVNAYDLGYLLRKLKDSSPVEHYISLGDDARSSSWHCSWELPVRYKVQADTPEDALCKLAIKLFKAGVLKKEAT